MENKEVKRSDQELEKQQQPGNLSSFNNKDSKRSTETEKAEEGKDESESCMDHKSSPEENAPAGEEKK